jgi:hypothetical protein
MISAPLETEVALIEKVMPGLSFEKLRAFEIDRSRVSFPINPANPVRSATLVACCQGVLSRKILMCPGSRLIRQIDTRQFSN